jgi:hypothetical protein
MNNKNDNLFLYSCLITSVLIFLTYLLLDLSILQLIIKSDSSKISLIILILYSASTIRWLYLSWQLDKESNNVFYGKKKEKKEITLIQSYFSNVKGKIFNEKLVFLNTLGDELSNRHSLGYLMIDTLLKLGLTGTVIGFIFMLLPIGSIKEFDPQILQQLLATMSGGMAIALYTTLTGLLTSMLLKFQYYLLDTAVINIINHLSSKFYEE